jgi:hypothetical protein
MLIHFITATSSQKTRKAQNFIKIVNRMKDRKADEEQTLQCGRAFFQNIVKHCVFQSSATSLSYSKTFSPAIPFLSSFLNFKGSPYVKYRALHH